MSYLKHFEVMLIKLLRIKPVIQNCLHLQQPREMLFLDSMLNDIYRFSRSYLSDVRTEATFRRLMIKILDSILVDAINMEMEYLVVDLRRSTGTYGELIINLYRFFLRVFEHATISDPECLQRILTTFNYELPDHTQFANTPRYFVRMELMPGNPLDESPEIQKFFKTLLDRCYSRIKDSAFFINMIVRYCRQMDEAINIGDVATELQKWIGDADIANKLQTQEGYLGFVERVEQIITTLIEHREELSVDFGTFMNVFFPNQLCSLTNEEEIVLSTRIVEYIKFLLQFSTQMYVRALEEHKKVFTKIDDEYPRVNFAIPLIQHMLGGRPVKTQEDIERNFFSKLHGLIDAGLRIEDFRTYIDNDPELRNNLAIYRNAIPDLDEKIESAFFLSELNKLIENGLSRIVFNMQPDSYINFKNYSNIRPQLHEIIESAFAVSRNPNLYRRDDLYAFERLERSVLSQYQNWLSSGVTEEQFLEQPERYIPEWPRYIAEQRRLFSPEEEKDDDVDQYLNF